MRTSDFATVRQTTDPHVPMWEYDTAPANRTRIFRGLFSATGPGHYPLCAAHGRAMLWVKHRHYQCPVCSVTHVVEAASWWRHTWAWMAGHTVGAR